MFMVVFKNQKSNFNLFEQFFCLKDTLVPFSHHTHPFLWTLFENAFDF